MDFLLFNHPIREEGYPLALIINTVIKLPPFDWLTNTSIPQLNIPVYFFITLDYSIVFLDNRPIPQSPIDLHPHTRLSIPLSHFPPLPFLSSSPIEFVNESGKKGIYLTGNYSTKNKSASETFQIPLVERRLRKGCETVAPNTQ